MSVLQKLLGYINLGFKKNAFRMNKKCFKDFFKDYINPGNIKKYFKDLLRI